MRNTGSEDPVRNAAGKAQRHERQREAMKQDRIAEIPRRKRSI